MIVALLWLAGGVAFLAGFGVRLHLKRAEMDHQVRMAELAAARARQDDEIKQARLERAHRLSLSPAEKTEVIPAVSADLDAALWPTDQDLADEQAVVVQPPQIGYC